MGRRGRHRDFRERVLALVEANDPELYAELIEIRSRNPQEYRKRIREAVVTYPIDGPQRIISNRLAYTHAQHYTDIDEVLAVEDVYTLRAALKRGNFDDRLDELVAAEKAGRNRPLTFHVIEEYRKRQLKDAEPRPWTPPVSEWVQKIANTRHTLKLPPKDGEDG